MFKKLFLSIISSTLFFCCCFSQNSKHKAEKIQLSNFENLYKLDKELFRSEQPSRDGMIQLEKYGLSTILNLRNIKRNKKNGTNLTLKHIRINTWNMSEAEVLEVLKIIEESPKPVLVHCKHGSDRTGVVIAAYRMILQNWSKEEAIAEFMKPEFGYHEKWFPNLLKLLQNMDLYKIRKQFE